MMSSVLTPWVSRRTGGTSSGRGSFPAPLGKRSAGGGRLRRAEVWSRYLRIEHTLFSVPLIYAGALLAEPPLLWSTALLILIAATGARTAALGLNRILDRRLDALNPRTAGRALPTGRIRLKSAWWAVVIATLAALFAAWAISPRCLAVAPIPLAAFVAYPLMKRWTRWAHLGLGATLAMGPVCGFYAVNLEWTGLLPVGLLAVFTVLWSAGFDILYATQDEESDRVSGVHSLPAALGVRAALRVAVFFHAGAFALLGALFVVALEGPLTALAFASVGALFVLQHRVRERLNLAFFRVNAALGAVVLLGVAVSGIPGG